MQPLNLPERTLSTFWAETRDSSLFGKHLAVVSDRCSSSGGKTQPTPFLRVIIPKRRPSAQHGVLSPAP